MKLKRILMIVLAIAVLSAQPVLAENRVWAKMDDGILKINWSADGNCVLTVYRNGWPLSVSYVDGASGGTEIRVPQEGDYSVRLKTDTWCETADVPESEEPATTQTPTQMPEIVEPTKAPATVAPTKVPVAAPEVTSAPQSGQSMTSMAAQVVSMVNAERAKYGLAPLSVDAQLTAAACVRAKEIVQKFSHTRPDGTSWFTVSAAAKGENIARGQSLADRVMAAWMTSEGHRKNILRESFGSIGVCALQVNGVIHWVQLFGR